MFRLLRELGPDLPSITRQAARLPYRLYNYSPALFWTVVFALIFGVVVFAIGYMGGRAAARDARASDPPEAE